MAQQKITASFAQAKPVSPVKRAAKAKAAAANGHHDDDGAAPWVPLVPSAAEELALRDMLMQQLAEQWRAKDEMIALLDSENMTAIFDDNIEVVRKTNVFKEQISEAEQAIIQQRVQLKQQQFAEFRRRSQERKLLRILSLYEYLSREEALRTLEDCNDDEDMAILKFTEPDFLPTLRRLIAESYKTVREPSLLDESAREEYEKLLQKRRRISKKTASSSDKQKMYSGGRLRLDDALRQLQSGADLEKAMEGWSHARIRAYKLINENPNAYYYRFNAPGEAQRGGKWTKAEHDMFMARLAELGADGQWGIFSMTIPGRVGYQCSNYYRTLLVKGVVKDPNYHISKGKAVYLFSTKKDKDGNVIVKKKSDADESDDESGGGGKRKRSSSVGGGSASKRRSRGSRHNNDDDEDEDEDDEFDFDDEEQVAAHTARYKSNAWKTTSRTRTLLGLESDGTENPLPGHVDPITLEEVVQPAISPHGHVMSFASWVQCLQENERCPLTKKPLKRSDLVVLTTQNIERYRDKIVAV